MQKTTLALAAVALVSGATHAAPATQFKEAFDGVGHMLIVPYYTAQAGNATLLNIVNTDKVNGKAVKVRFRGASNADDVFNFTLFLSPGDVWAAEISQNPATGTLLTSFYLVLYLEIDTILLCLMAVSALVGVGLMVLDRLYSADNKVSA